MTRILIVDDDPEQARALSRTFTKLRPELAICTASNGVAATQLLLEGNVDLLLTDLQMPEMDGFELLVWVHNNCPDVAVLTMSAYGTGETQARLCDLGASDYFAKPVDEQAVLARLTETLTHSVRGHVHNLSLASFLQLLEMERKSCTLTVSCEGRSGVLAIRKGVLVAAHTDELLGEAAAIAIVAWPSPSIGISRHNELGATTIQSSLGYIVMEAMRQQDEAARLAGNEEKKGSVWPAQARRTWRPTGAPRDSAFSFDSKVPPAAELVLPSGTRGLALVETATGNVLRATASPECPIGELARLAAQLLLQEAATLSLCSEAEGVEELVLSTRLHCDLIRPLSPSEFALLVFAPEETNLVLARIELEQFVVSHQRGKPLAD